MDVLGRCLRESGRPMRCSNFLQFPADCAVTFTVTRILGPVRPKSYCIWIGFLLGICGSCPLHARVAGRRRGGPWGAGSTGRSSARDARCKALLPDGFAFDDIHEVAEVEAARVERHLARQIVRFAAFQQVLRIAQQLRWVVQQSVIVAKRDQNLLQRHLQMATEALVVTLVRPCQCRRG